MNKTKLIPALGMSTLLFCAGCSSVQAPTAAPTPKAAAYNGTSDIEVNGVVPKGKVGATFKTVFEQTDASGMTHIVSQVTRKPGYRSAVHYMTYGTTTCVNQGQATMELDDGTLETYKAGECYIMPAGVKGYIANNGKTVQKLTDFSLVPSGEHTMVMLEN